jgi:hypothetical protein
VEAVEGVGGGGAFPCDAADDGREAAVGKEGVGGGADARGVVAAAALSFVLVAKGAPLGALVDDVRLDDEAAVLLFLVLGVGVVCERARGRRRRRTTTRRALPPPSPCR